MVAVDIRVEPLNERCHPIKTCEICGERHDGERTHRPLCDAKRTQRVTECVGPGAHPKRT